MPDENPAIGLIISKDKDKTEVQWVFRGIQIPMEIGAGICYAQGGRKIGEEGAWVRVLFCNIAWMDYYKGIFAGIDEPQNGGSFVKATKDAHEKYNFEPVKLQFNDGSMPDGEYCLGFVETKSTKGGRNQLHIEKISGCKAMDQEESIDDVLVIYCAKHPYHKFTSVVGWYKHATVYRHYCVQEFPSADEEGVYEQSYNAFAKKEDCVLLPRTDRRITEWNVPRRQAGAVYGFGQANVWYAEEDTPLLKEYLDKIITKILNYSGENWIDEYPQMADEIPFMS